MMPIGMPKRKGCDFHINYESRSRDQSLKNIRFLKRYKRMQFPDEEKQIGSTSLHWYLQNRVSRQHLALAGDPTIGLWHYPDN